MLLRHGVIDPQDANQLRLILELRDFAESNLDLRVGRSYLNYADLRRDHVVWSVFASPEFSLDPKTWKYPVVGALDYRGFFNADDAWRCASELESKGFDAYVAEVDAYSTLGWLPDPVLNTFIGYSEVELAELIFHELTHRRIYRSGETAFNEALATCVAEEGVLRWLRAREKWSALRDYESRLTKISAIYAEIKATRTALQALFAQPNSEDHMRAQKRAILRDLQRRLKTLFSNWGGRVPDSWLDKRPNNARLNASATYYEHVPMLKRHLLEEFDGDLQKFLDKMETVDVGAFQQAQ